LHLLAGHTWAVATISTLLAFVLQSSTAAMGFGIGLASTGLFTSEAMISWVLGANLGIALTTLLAGWNNLEARRMACANLAAKGVSAGAMLFCLPLLKIGMPESKTLLASQTVHFHTLFNLAVGIVSLPFVPLISRLMRTAIAPAPITVLAGPATHLDTNALDSPSLALANATREVLRIADEVRLMLQNFWQAQVQRDRTLAAIVHSHDDEVDDTAAAVTEYLSRISQESLSSQDTHWQFTLLSCANELESIGDIIDKNLCDFVRKQAGHGFPMTAEDEQILGEAYERIKYRCDVTFSLITTRDATIATQIIRSEESLEEWFRQEQRSHYERLRFGGERVLQSSVYFLDMLGSFRRISSHLTSIAYSFVAVDFESETSEGVNVPAPTAKPAAESSLPQARNAQRRAA
jgi:phosphate:Na+ symporter